MAKKKDTVELEIGASVNEYKPTHVREAVKRIEALVGEKESARGSYMNRCEKINERINAVVDQASRQGIEAKALRKVITVRRKRQAAQAVLAELDDELRTSVEALLRANDDPNDLPLFKAALVHEADGNVDVRMTLQ